MSSENLHVSTHSKQIMKSVKVRGKIDTGAKQSMDLRDKKILGFEG